MSKRTKSLAAQAPPVAEGWTSLTWEDLDRWAGSRSVSRGRASRQDRVKNLSITEDGRLLANVLGGERYYVSVWHAQKRAKSSSLQSQCSCPVGHDGCKHAVAVVAAYLQSVGDGTPVPVAGDDDPRWKKLVAPPMEEDEDGADDIDVEEGFRSGRSGRRTSADWDRRIEKHIREKSAAELANLVIALTERFPELRDEFRERIAISEGDGERLVHLASRELREVTSEVGWQNSWSGEGRTPNYSRLKGRLQGLMEMGRSDDVVPLGRELIQRGMAQVGESHDEGETGMALADCLSVVFLAVAASRLSGAEKILFGIDAQLSDEYDIIHEEANPLLDGPWNPADWSVVADSLQKRLGKPVQADGDEFSRKYRRDGIANWLMEALTRAGRQDEQLAMLEAEARATHSYERLVKHLIATERFEDAERWAREGIEKTCKKWPGIAASLSDALCDLARRRKQWSVVAAHSALEFLRNPDIRSFNELMESSKRAKCEKPVREAALRFLESGVSPIRCVPSDNKGFTVDPDWPLPFPEYLFPMLHDPRYPPEARPHFDVLLEMTIADKHPEGVLKWYDKMQAADKRGNGWNRYTPAEVEHRVADAVARSHPERALEILGTMLNGQLTHAHKSAYESAAATLRRMRPVFKSLGREEEWKQLVQGIRAKHRNRPRFVEIIDGLDGRTILETSSIRGGTR